LTDRIWLSNRIALRSRVVITLSRAASPMPELAANSISLLTSLTPWTSQASRTASIFHSGLLTVPVMSTRPSKTLSES
jgi:hypothetical protein